MGLGEHIQREWEVNTALETARWMIQYAEQSDSFSPEVMKDLKHLVSSLEPRPSKDRPFGGNDLMEATFNCLTDRIDTRFFPVNKKTVQEYMENHWDKIEEDIYQTMDELEADILISSKASHD